MKKTYSKPATSTESVDLQRLCDVVITESPADGSTVQARRRDDFDDEEEYAAAMEADQATYGDLW